MKTPKLILFLFFALIISSCNSLPKDYHMQKAYWDPSDYNAAIEYIRYSLNQDEGYPRLSDPKTAPVFLKLVDKQNVSVVIEDLALGLNHRGDQADEFFDAAKDLYKAYARVDIQDKFVYPMELVSIIDFMLHTQILYFNVHNEDIIHDALDPKDPGTLNTVRRNQQIMVDNFSNYIDLLAQEDAFTKEAIEKYADVIDIYYTRLVLEYPKLNFSDIKNTSTKLLNKISSEKLRASLESLVKQIELAQVK